MTASATGPAVEEVVLLDEDGRAIGTMAKSAVHHQATPLHLAFSCYLFDDAGRVLLTQRAHDKVTWPGAWTNTCCGHPGPGERLEDAVRRRLRQELGLDCRALVVALPAFRYHAVMDDGTVENEMCPVVVGRCADPDALAPDPTEVADTSWVPWRELRREVLAGLREVSPWCRSQVEQLSDDPLVSDPLPGRLPASLA